MVSLVLDVGLSLLAAGKGATIFSAFTSHCATEITHIVKEAPSKEGCSRPGLHIFDLELSNNALSIKKTVTVPANTPTGQRVIQSTENMKL